MNDTGEIDLGELTLRSADFIGCVDTSDAAERANTLLRERLGSMEKIFFHYDENNFISFTAAHRRSDGSLDTGARLNDTHTARLVSIQPIQRDSAENLLRDIANDETYSAMTWNQIQDRAKRLLEKERGNG